MKSSFKISARLFLRLSCLALFLVFILASLFTIRSATSISELAGKVRREQLPLVVESQRAFLNIEGLRRIAELTYLSGERESRRQARVKAQSLAAASLYFTDQSFHASALKAASDIAILAGLRDSSEEHGRRMRFIAGEFENELLQTVYHVSDDTIKSFFLTFRDTSLYSAGGLDLAPSGIEALAAMQESDAEQVAAIVDQCQRGAAGNRVLGAACSRLELHYAEYEAARSALQADLAAARAQWEQIDLSLREMRDTVGSGAERASILALGDIENLAARELRNRLIFGLLSVAAFVLFLVLLKRHILQPLSWNAAKLAEIRAGQTGLERPDFMLREVDDVAELLNSFSGYLAELYEQRDKLQLDSEQMSNLEQIMRVVFKASVDGYCVWSPSELRMVNRRMLSLLGASAPAESGGPGGLLSSPEDLPFERPGEIYQQVLESGLVRGERTIEDVSGNPLPVEITSLPVRLSSGTYVLSYFRDLREQKEYERNLRQAKEEAEAAAEAKSLFLARMGHEIRTPLNGVLGLTQVALKKSPATEQKRYLERIAGSAMILLQVIKDILDFSNMGSSGYQLENSVFSMREMLSTVADNILPPARQKKLVFKVFVEQSMPDSFYGDNLRLAQVLLNLCDNAVKFTERGTVTLQVQHSFVKDVPGDCAAVRALELADAVSGTDVLAPKLSELRFTVSDTGVGIPREKLAEIFQPFSQGDPTSTRLQGGMGLGLPISRHLVRMMGGEITVMSTPGQGSIFSFALRLPRVASAGWTPGVEEEGRQLAAGGDGVSLGLAPGDSPDGLNEGGHFQDSVSADPRQILKARKALLVEDNPLNQEIALSLLEDVGMSVLVADNGVAALECLEINDVDIVLMDIQMPVMDGLTAASRIRGHERERVRRLPVLAVTAQSLPEEREKCYAAGMNDHVSKPLDAEELYAKMALWIGRTEGWQG